MWTNESANTVKLVRVTILDGQGRVLPILPACIKRGSLNSVVPFIFPQKNTNRGQNPRSTGRSQWTPTQTHRILLPLGARLTPRRRSSISMTRGIARVILRVGGCILGVKQRSEYEGGEEDFCI